VEDGSAAILEFPETRENNREFCKIPLIRRVRAPIPAVIPMRCRQIPCFPQERKLLRNFNALQANSLFPKEQGIFSRGTGNLFDGTGNFLKDQGIQGIP
jgi:hypothetical protein